MSEETNLPERVPAPIKVLTQVDREILITQLRKSEDECIKGERELPQSTGEAWSSVVAQFPELHLHLIFRIQDLEKMIATAREKGTACMEWNINQPKIKMCLETVAEGGSHMHTKYTEALQNHHMVPLQVGLI